MENYIEIVYQPKDNNEDKIRLFGRNFINNNKDKCKIVYKRKTYELKEYLEDIDHKYNYKDEIILQ